MKNKKSKNFENKNINKGNKNIIKGNKNNKNNNNKEILKFYNEILMSKRKSVNKYSRILRNLEEY
jgi:hypothetical protein